MIFQSGAFIFFRTINVCCFTLPYGLLLRLGAMNLSPIPSTFYMSDICFRSFQFFKTDRTLCFRFDLTIYFGDQNLATSALILYVIYV